MYKNRKAKFLKKAKNKHGDKYDYSKVKYIKSSEKIEIICKKHGVFLQEPRLHTQGFGCRKCGDEKMGLGNRVTVEQFIHKANTKFKDIYVYDKKSYYYDPLTKRTTIMIKCKKHGWFKQRTDQHLYGVVGCKKCSSIVGGSKRSIDTKTFIKNARQIHGDLYEYDKVKYTSHREKVKIKCRKHGYFLQTPDWHIKGKGNCPICNYSKGELRIKQFLDKNNIRYKKEYVIKDTKYRYDFYLPDLNMLIEYDGVQHFKPVKYWGGITHLEKIKLRDQNKNILAEINGLYLIRIKYTSLDQIEKTLCSYIKKRFRYRIKNNFYKTFIELCRALNKPKQTMSKDVEKYSFSCSL